MSDAVIKMIVTCVAWVVAYFVVLFITNKAGVGYNVLKNSLKWLVELKKLCVGLRAQLSSKGFTLQSKSAIHGLKKVVRCEKGIARILTVYMFDKKDDKNVSQAMDLVSSVPELCRKAAAIAGDGRSEDLSAVFSQVDDCISRASSLIRQSIERDMKEELLKV